MVRGGARRLLSPNVALRACESFQSLEVSAKERGAGGGTPPASPPRHTCIVAGTEPNTLVGREICQFQPVWSKHTPDFLLEVMERLGDLCAGKDDELSGFKLYLWKNETELGKNHQEFIFP